MNTNELIVWDCIQVMKEFPSKSIDLICTDPPYEFTSKKSWGGGFYKNENKQFVQEVEKNIWLSFNPIPLLNESKRLCKRMNWYYFTNKNLLETYIKRAEQNKYSRDILLRLKPNPVPLFNSHYLTDKEYIVYIHDQWATFNSNMKLENYFTYKSYPIGTSIHNHPTVKPKELLYNIIKISSNENDIVLDPYIWSWTTAVVCKRFKRRYIWIDINEEYINIAKRRLQNI